MDQGQEVGTSGRSWVASLPADLARQRTLIEALLSLCESDDRITSLSVGCSVGRGAADALSDVDAAIGVDAARGAAGAPLVREVEAAVVAVLPRVGAVVDVLRRESIDETSSICRVFAQWPDRLQLDLAVIAEPEVRRGEAAPDFVSVYVRDGHAGTTAGRSAFEVSGDQVEEWAFAGWRGLLDADKYLRRGSVWEAHQRLHEVRDTIWRLWAAGHGASYPWHGLSQVLDHDPGLLPDRIVETVAGLDVADLRRALVAAADVLDDASALAAARWDAALPTRMGEFARGVLAGAPDDARG